MVNKSCKFSEKIPSPQYPVIQSVWGLSLFSYLCTPQIVPMIFNSFEFLLFLPLTFLVYWMVFKGRTPRNLFIIAASYTFYGWWNVKLLGLIAFTTLCSYLSGLVIERLNDRRHRAALAVLWVNVAINLGILGMFKYFDFFAHSFYQMMNAIGWGVDDITLGLVLPVGISFYTFQALSYSIDVYRRKIEASHDVPAFFAFISFFPQLVAGPIERASNLLPQFMRSHRFEYSMGVSGMRQILWGLFKKMVVADNCAEAVDFIFGDYTSMGAANLWIGAALFSFQIYGDFSGYSDIAVGTARMFGFELMRNFKLPYFSRDIGEFWRRWHISLTTWFRDYVYIPMGGSRVSKPKKVRNTFVIFLLSGFWHGATWGYLAWGAFHAVLFVPMILTGRNRKYLDEPAAGRRLPSINEAALMAWTFTLVVIGLVLYRAGEISDAWECFKIMFTGFIPPYSSMPLIGFVPLCWVAVMMGAEWMTRTREHPLDFGPGERGLLRSRMARCTLYYVIFMTILFFSGNQQQFIYFQF